MDTGAEEGNEGRCKRGAQRGSGGVDSHDQAPLFGREPFIASRFEDGRGCAVGLQHIDVQGGRDHWRIEADDIARLVVV